MKFVFKKDLDLVSNVKGVILSNNNRIYLVQRSNIFTVWRPEDGFIFIHTFCEKEAEKVYKKYVEWV